MVFMLTLGFLFGCFKAYLWTERNIVSGEGIGLKVINRMYLNNDYRYVI